MIVKCPHHHKQKKREKDTKSCSRQNVLIFCYILYQELFTKPKYSYLANEYYFFTYRKL